MPISNGNEMNQEHDYFLFHAWRQAYRNRCCPPADLLFRDRRNHLVTDHLQICPFCREDLKQGEKPPPIGTAEQTSPHPDPQPGEVWNLKAQLAGWGPKKRYYAPPVVLAVDRHSLTTVSVVQIYGDVSLAAADDLPLDNGLQGFAEPWNRYTLPTDFFRYHLGTVSPALLARLRHQPEEMAPIAPGSLLWFFRHMEVETGFMTANQGISQLVDSPGEEPGHCFDDSRSLAEQLKGFALHLPERLPSDPLELLARCRPADDLLPLAASADTEVTALCITTRHNTIEQVQPIQTQITDRAVSPETLHLGGLFPDGFQPHWQCYFWWLHEQTLIEPLAGQFGTRDNLFWVTFPLQDRGDGSRGRLIIRILDLH